MHPASTNKSAATTKSASSARVAALLLLCPLLAVSDSVINALGLGIVAILVTLAASVPLSVTLQRLPDYGRIATVVATVAAVVTCAVLLANAYFHELYLAIGAYLPLLVASGLLIARYEVVAQRDHRLQLVIASFRIGLVFASVLLALGATREFVGRGSLLFGAHALPFLGTDLIERQFFHPDLGFVLATLPPGAFIAMGVLFAIRNWYRGRSRQP
jgi:electron transport complex protein RnfE